MDAAATDIRAVVIPYERRRGAGPCARRELAVRHLDIRTERDASVRRSSQVHRVIQIADVAASVEESDVDRPHAVDVHPGEKLVRLVAGGVVVHADPDWIVPE